MRRAGSLVKDFTTSLRARCLLQVGVLFILSTGTPCPSVSAQDSAKQVRQPESALRARVEQFYNFLSAGNWSKAENYVTRESLDTFRNQTKTPFQSFQIGSVELEPDGRRATLHVTINVMTPYSAGPFPFSLTTHWRLDGRVWYVEVPKPPRHTLQAMFPQAPAEKSASPQESPPAELKFEYVEAIVDPIQPGEVKVARFPFTNVSDHAVRLGKVVTGCDCMRLKGEKREYKPGESGTLEFEWDPVHRDYSYALEDTISVKTEPGGAVTYLMARTVVAPGVAGDSKSLGTK